ncbi:MAG: hypothetical protein M1361_00500 [Patescibacteria group bacterium]|nr:hypothetical protein [Patescibacteria group bacterium]MCL5224093.1 hypothetical protein [Patescibacteria group bacterium]
MRKALQSARRVVQSFLKALFPGFTDKRFWGSVKITYIFVYLPIGILLVLLNGFFSAIFLIYAAVGVATILVGARLSCTDETIKTSRSQETTKWVIAILIALAILGSVRGAFSFVCENVQANAYPEGITLGWNRNCVSFELNGGEMSPWIYAPLHSYYIFTSYDHKPFTVFYGDGSHYHLGVNQNLDFGTSTSDHFRFMPDGNGTEIVIALTSASTLTNTPN